MIKPSIYMAWHPRFERYLYCIHDERGYFEKPGVYLKNAISCYKYYKDLEQLVKDYCQDNGLIKDGVPICKFNLTVTNFK
jgi:hypothetical protein